MKEKKGSLKSTIAVSLTNYLDAGSIVAGASGLTLWQKYLGLNETDLGLLNAISANCFGAAIGAIIGGILADKYGRKMIYTYNMLIYILGVGIIMFAINFPMLLAGFLITGISVGAGVPASWTYISETSETKNRGRNIGISQFAWSIGPAIIFILGMSLADLGLLGNRIIFGSLFVVGIIAWILQRQLKESEAWEESRAEIQTSKKQTNSYRELFSNIVNIKTILYLVGIYLTWNLVAGAMGFFMPHVYETAGGISNQDANKLQAIVWGITAFVTYFGFAKLADKINQRFLYFVGTSIGVIAWIVLTYVGITNKIALLVFVILWGVHAGFGVQAFYALWASELFPAKYRAAAQGIMFFIVRTGAAIWSFVFTYVYDKSGFYTAGQIMIVLLVIALVVGVIWTPKTRGKTLDQITKERYKEEEIYQIKTVLENRSILTKKINEVAEVAGYLWQKGWAERNGGNIVLNITEWIDEEIRKRKPISEIISIGQTLPYIKNCYFYCKGTNKRMRDLSRWPMENGSIIKILDDGASYVIIADQSIKPTSELPSHLAMHNFLIKEGTNYKASLHTHPIDLVAMTHNREFLEKDRLTYLLWSMIPETRAFCPKGLGIIPYKMPGSVELAEATVAALKEYDVVMWEKHGVCSVSENIMEAFDMVDTLSKSAQIYLTARSMGFEPEGTSFDDMLALKEAFNLPK